MKPFNPACQKKQQGVVLITALIFLMVLTLLGLSSIDNTVMENKLALNNQERVKAFQMSEAALAIYADLVNNAEVQSQLIANGRIDTSSTYENGDPILELSPLIDNVEIIYKGTFSQQRNLDKAYINSAINAPLVTYFEVIATGRNAWVDADGDDNADGVVRTFTIRSGVIVDSLY